MKNPVRPEVERSLTELSDEEAVAIMEGRHPPEDRSETAEAARTLAVNVVADSDQQPSTASGGGSVIQLFARQPWMRMAAAVTLGVVVGTLVRAPGEPADSAPERSVASANVVYLETTRSAEPADVPRVHIPGDEPWITLIAYPDFRGAELLRLQLERAVGQDSQSAADIRSGEWKRVLNAKSGLGTKDSVVLTINSALLEPGYYRLNVVSDKGSEGTNEASYSFMVVR